MINVLMSDGEAALVSWARRMKIVIGIARGLKYLHMELDPPFTISELSSNAIYLTEDFTPKVKCKVRPACYLNNTIKLMFL